MSSLKKKYVSPQLKKWSKIVDTFQNIDINLSKTIQAPAKRKLLLARE